MPKTNPLEEHTKLILHMSDAALLRFSPPHQQVRTISPRSLSPVSRRPYFALLEMAPELGLGHLQRVTVEFRGRTSLVQSYLPPASRLPEGQKNGSEDLSDESASGSTLQTVLRSPTLVTTVLTASLMKLREADRAMRRLGSIGRKIQKA
jgi:hypothetical protein